MKLPMTKLKQPTLTDEFRPRVAPPVQARKMRRATLLAAARVLPVGTRHNADPYDQQAKMAEMKRLIFSGMSRAEASQKVWG